MRPERPAKPRRFVDDFQFHSVEAIQRALEEYASFHNGTKCPRYGREPMGDGNALQDKWECVMRQNRAIDRAMHRLRHIEPLSHRLLDVYYRSGWCYEANGWRRAAARVGLPMFAGDHHRAAFDLFLERAVSLLFYAHRIRPRRCS